MSGLLRSYGRGLTALFAGAVLLWALLLILLPQFAMFERAITAPKRLLDSSIAATLRFDAATCLSVLETQSSAPSPTAHNGGMAVPSLGGMAIPSPNKMPVPSPGGMAVPSFGASKSTGTDAVRPYVLQCDRANTHKALVRESGERLWLDQVYGLPPRSVDPAADIAIQKAQASEIRDLAHVLYQTLLVQEATASKLTLSNFGALVSAKALPLGDAARATEEARLSNKIYSSVGLRFERDGVVHERLGLTNLARTLFFAVLVTGLALVLCYPIAYKVALASTPQRVMWLMLGLIIPYAIVELMRVYAWTTIIDNRGLLNSAMLWAGLIAEPIAFTRMPGTVFVVIVYTYVLFMVFPILNVMSTLDRNQIEAAQDLGAPVWRLHWRVVIPHAKPGIAVGCISTFMLAAGAFSVPRIISRGLQAEWFSQTIYNKFFESENSNVGAAYSFAYTAVCFLIVALFMWQMRTRLKDFARVQQ